MLPCCYLFTGLPPLEIVLEGRWQRGPLFSEKGEYGVSFKEVLGRRRAMMVGKRPVLICVEIRVPCISNPPRVCFQKWHPLVFFREEGRSVQNMPWFHSVPKPPTELHELCSSG